MKSILLVLLFSCVSCEWLEEVAPTEPTVPIAPPVIDAPAPQDANPEDEVTDEAMPLDPVASDLSEGVTDDEIEMPKIEFPEDISVHSEREDDKEEVADGLEKKLNDWINQYKQKE